MDPQQIGELATIASRYKTLKIFAQTAYKSIANVRQELFTDFVTKDEELILINAERLLNVISGKCNERDAIKYFESLYKEIQP